MTECAWQNPCLEPESRTGCRSGRARHGRPASVVPPWRGHSGVNAAFCTLLNGSGEALYEILTIADAIPLPVAGPRADGNLFWHGSVRPPLQRGGNHIWSRPPRLGSRAAYMWAGSGPNAAPSAIYRRFPVIRQLSKPCRSIVVIRLGSLFKSELRTLLLNSGNSQSSLDHFLNSGLQGSPKFTRAPLQAPIHNSEQ